MIFNPSYGWCDFKLGSFQGTPSYLTDVPFDLLNAFINRHYGKSAAVFFDEEGTEFTLVINYHSMFIIEERKEKPILHDFSFININELEKELINDIESNIDGWVSDFFFNDSEEEKKEYKEKLLELLKKLKKLGRYE